MVQMMKY